MAKLKITKNKKIAAYLCIVALVLAATVGLAFWSETHTAAVPILMYHQVRSEGDVGTTLSAALFEEHLQALRGAGFTAISVHELREYAVNGTPLPERPVMLTFDDGYTGVYSEAFPLLQKYNVKATVFIIGVLLGADTYKGIPYLPITPHFGAAEALEMQASGLVSIQSHTYDMHQFEPYELTGTPRTGVLRVGGESREEYAEALENDFMTAVRQIEEITGEAPIALSYPQGRYTGLADKILRELGVEITMTIDARINRVVKGFPESLYNLGRINVPGDMSPEDLIATISGFEN